MLKLVYCIRKRADVSPETFYRYWLEEHSALVRRFARTLRAREYVQSHTITPEINTAMARGRGLAPAYDGIAELWWDSLEDFLSSANTAEGDAARRALQEDEARFIDFSQSCMFLTKEQRIFDREDAMPRTGSPGK